MSLIRVLSSVDQSFDANLMITKASAKSLLLCLVTGSDLLTLSVIKDIPRLERQYNLSLLKLQGMNLA